MTTTIPPAQRQSAIFQENRTRSLHLIDRTIHVAGFEADSTTPVCDHVCVEAELPRIECAVFHTIVQRQTEQINVPDGALLQIVGESRFPTMRIVKKRAVAVDT